MTKNNHSLVYHWIYTKLNSFTRYQHNFCDFDNLNTHFVKSFQFIISSPYNIIFSGWVLNLNPGCFWNGYEIDQVGLKTGRILPFKQENERRQVIKRS